MEGRTPTFSWVFFCMFGNHLHGCFYRNMIVELTFQVWIPVKNQEVTKPNIESTILLSCLGKKNTIFTCCHTVLCTEAEENFSNIQELRNDGANYIPKLNVITCIHLTTCSQEYCI